MATNPDELEACQLQSRVWFQSIAHTKQKIKKSLCFHLNQLMFIWVLIGECTLERNIPSNDVQDPHQQRHTSTPASSPRLLVFHCLLRDMGAFDQNVQYFQRGCSPDDLELFSEYCNKMLLQNRTGMSKKENMEQLANSAGQDHIP